MTIRLRVPTRLDPDEAASRLWDARRHTAVIPLTRLDTEGRLDRKGLRFTSRTSLGPVGFDDVMVVRRADGGEVVIDKVGDVLGGTIVAATLPSADGAVVDWAMDLRVRGLPPLAQPVVDVVAGVMYGIAIRGLLRRPTSGPEAGVRRDRVSGEEDR